MSKSVRARIHWLSSEEGGRLSVPSGKRYATVARFAEDAETWLQETWSIVLEFDNLPSGQSNPCVGCAQFLAEDAPVDRLTPGRTFELYEGRKKAAVVEIVEAV